MTEQKPWYLSRTVWASIVTIATTMGGVFGLPLAGLDNSAVTDTILQVAAAISGVVALWGRIVATNRIGS
ncbi:hypothetical protein EJC49_06480 [Aquibium carbonis]|uniref:Holin n=1 Tax=Aquibium carbonis TaxID=2495581 RepID=A0A3S0A2D0_9HYPH|nr:hypothetical protein [Aquibium carbonis]RST87239.1 hypothetical protein EJC49_06480 [Aquibium carbonis]